MTDTVAGPSQVSQLTGRYRQPQKDIYASWMVKQATLLKSWLSEICSTLLLPFLQAPVYRNCKRPNVTNYNVTHNVTDGDTGGSGSSGAPIIAMNETDTVPANQTWYLFDKPVYGNVYFVEVTPSNTYGFGEPSVIFISEQCMCVHTQH